MPRRQDQYAAIYYSTLIASLGGLIVGYSTVIISGALLFLDNTFNLKLVQQEVIVSTAILFAILGTVFGGIVCNLFGRKKAIITSALIFMIASILSLFSDRYEMLVISRSIMGFGAGIASMAIPFYISEIVPPNIRGSCVCMITLLFFMGVLLAYIIDRSFAYNLGWRFTLSSPFIPALGLLIGMFYVPESPQWLMGNNKFNKAKRALEKLRRSVDVEREIENIKESSQFSDKLREHLWGRGVLKVILIGCAIAFFMEITGAHSIFYYLPTLLKTTGLWTQRGAINVSIYMGLVGLISAFAAILLIDLCGRRKLLLYGTGAMVMALFFLGIIFHFPTTCKCHSILILLLLFLFTSGFVIGLGSVGWLLISEIFPLKIRSFLIASAIAVKWATNFLVARFFLTELALFGKGITFWIYCSINIICLFFIYFFIPETTGKSLISIEEYWLTDTEHELEIK